MDDFFANKILLYVLYAKLKQIVLKINYFIKKNRISSWLYLVQNEFFELERSLAFQSIFHIIQNGLIHKNNFPFRVAITFNQDALPLVATGIV